MEIVSALAIYFIIWWLMIFITLALGNRDPDPDDVRVEGAAPSAPARPRLWRRMALNTVLSTIVFAIVYAILHSGITLDDIPLPKPPERTTG